jgi:cysteine-rich repeat protein
MRGCGDGTMQRGEICDDGNTVGGDGCSADCMSDESCGNGIPDRDAGEICDDGNTMGGDACAADCSTDYTCGNGVVDTIAAGGTVDEACDDGNTINGDGCDAACASTEICGNSIVDVGEMCDDGNTVGGDLCSADCTMSVLCGNGVLDTGEECDDNNFASSDGCSSICQREVCGNGRVDAAESCDDSNADDADGCRADCTFTCATAADCADGAPCNGDEVCTDPGTTASRCGAGTPLAAGASCGTGLICNGGACVAIVCGDGFVSGTEQCDDTNTVNGDGCDNDCTFSCTAAADCNDTNPCTMDACTANVCSNTATTGGACTTTGGAAGTCNMGMCAASASCGNGTREGTEQCDDGNAVNNDGCRSDCTFTCTAANAATNCDDANTCTNNTCMGTGLASRCISANVMNGTACDLDAMASTRDICRIGVCRRSTCGDGFTDTAAMEACDDGNTTNGDGCDNDCTFTCTAATAVADCGDRNTCNGAEVCTGTGLASRCGAGMALPVGAACDADMMAATRDICRAGNVCQRSLCGDGFRDTMATPAEGCDDGNTTAGDGCSATCTVEMSTTAPTAFRFLDLDLISPRIVVNVPLGGCQDITNNCARAGFLGCQADGVNTQIQNALTMDADMPPDGLYDLSVVSLFRPLGPTSPTSPLELYLNPDCTTATPASCSPGMATMLSATATNLPGGSTCFTPVAAEVNTRAGGPAAYAPTVSTVSGPCFNSSETTLTISLSGIMIPLERATVSATYSGTPTNQLVSGVIRGFLTERAAADTLLPMTLPAPLGGAPLYTVLQAGNRSVMNSMGATVADSCNLSGGTNEDDADMNGTARGFWFFLNFRASLATWTGP